MKKMKYELGTELITRQPWGIFVGGSALCSDGKVRKLKRIAPTADTLFSIPASVTVKGKTVAGFVSVESMSGLSVAYEGDPPVVRFTSYMYRKNGGLLP